MRNAIVVLGVLLLVGAVALIAISDRRTANEEGQTEEVANEEEESEEVDEEAESTFEFSNATYRIEGEELMLEGGEYNDEVTTEGGITTTVHAELVDTAEGNLNADGETDGAVVLMHDPGGTAILYYVAGVVSTETGHESTESVMIGDRIDVRSIQIQDNVIEVELLTRAEDEPFAVEPTVEETQRFRLDGDALVEVEEVE